MIPIFPDGYLERFAREHPVQAVLVCAWGLGLLGFAVWLYMAR